MLTYRYKIDIKYDGTKYHGWQKQPKQITIQEEIEKVLNSMLKDKDKDISIKVYGSGRTDAGVHAIMQVAHFDFPYKIPLIGFQKGINAKLPFDIKVTNIKYVSKDFHAQYSTHSKRYIYKLSTEEFRNPFKYNHTGYWHRKINIELIKIAIKDYVGEHDWINFVSTGFQSKTTNRTVYSADVEEHPEIDEIWFIFSGNGFLYNQVRIMVGTLLEIGNGIRAIDDIKRLQNSDKINESHFTAPASGLYLDFVQY